MGNEITPLSLIRQLHSYGYAVTERCLTDWRYKGYLPQLSRRSLGYRRGVLRYWSQIDILKLALELCRRLKGPERKRMFGAVHKNWLGGAEIPALRAKDSWLRESKRLRHMPQFIIQKCASEAGRALGLTTTYVRDILQELLQVWLQPNHLPGIELDITLLGRFIRRACTKLGASKLLPMLSEQNLAQALTCVNLLFSPAAVSRVVASATAEELRSARDRYLNWWRNLDPCWGRLLSNASENWSLMPLAISLAPLFVPFLLPSKTEIAAPMLLEAG